MSQPQQVLNLHDVLANQAAWDADVQANVVALKNALRTLKPVISVQGSHTSPSTITFQLQDANGFNITSEQFYLRIRVCNNGAYANATNATVAAGAGTTLVETITANKDLVFQSSAAGLVTLTLTDATIETFTVRPAPATIQPVYCNHNVSIDCVHA